MISIQVGTFNRTGQRYQGHFNIWITNRIQELSIALEDIFVNSDEASQLTSWVNGNLYQPSEEVIGVVPVPESIRKLSGMAPFEPLLNDPRQRHHFLSKLQGTRKPVLLIHTTNEKELFRKLRRENPTFNSPTSDSPNWKQAVVVWNGQADESSSVGITYKVRNIFAVKVEFVNSIHLKLPEHLALYFSSWKTRVNVKETLSLTLSERAPITKAIRDPNRSLVAPSTEAQTLQPISVTQGFVSVKVADNSQQGHAPEAPGTSLGTQIAKKRVNDQLESMRPVKKVKIRHCGKCGEATCNGKMNVQRCLNRCQDCQRHDCPGRNTKKRDVPCHRRDE